jgi:hypothetical protein
MIRTPQVAATSEDTKQIAILAPTVYPVLYLKISKNSTATAWNLKGLSHEIDFKNFDKKLHNLA